MGLDMYAYKVPRYLRINNLKFDTGGIDYTCSYLDFCYWRKHYPLDKWMQRIYKKKGGQNEFNGDYVELTKEEILQLTHDIKSGLIDYANYYDDNGDIEWNRNHDLGFCDRALELLDKGYYIYYSNSW